MAAKAVDPRNIPLIGPANIARAYKTTSRQVLMALLELGEHPFRATPRSHALFTFAQVERALPRLAQRAWRET
jgi:hypothetical protein